MNGALYHKNVIVLHPDIHRANNYARMLRDRAGDRIMARAITSREALIPLLEEAGETWAHILLFSPQVKGIERILTNLKRTHPLLILICLGSEEDCAFYRSRDDLGVEGSLKEQIAYLSFTGLLEPEVKRVEDARAGSGLSYYEQTLPPPTTQPIN